MEGNKTNVDGGSTAFTRRKLRVRTQAFLGALVVAGIGLSACGGGSATPEVANVTTSSSAGVEMTATTVPKNNAAKLLVEWADCMRSHDDPNQPDPILTAPKLIDINWNGTAISGGPWGTEKGGHGNSGPGQFCRTYLQAAVNSLQGSRRLVRPSSAELLKYSACMRENGFPDFPDPSGNGGLQLNVGSAMSLSNPVFERADKRCAQKTGVQPFGTGNPPPGTIELNGENP